jgi:hypothetical protein
MTLYVSDPRPHKLSASDLPDAALRHAIDVLVPSPLREELLDRYRVDFFPDFVFRDVRSGEHCIPRLNAACVLVEAGMSLEDVYQYVSRQEPILLRRYSVLWGMPGGRTVRCIACPWKRSYSPLVVEGQAERLGIEAWKKHEDCPGIR